MLLMPAQFNALGISYQYPENWTLDDSDAMLGRRSVTVYSPGGAFWSVAIHPSKLKPEAITAKIIQEMQAEYESLEIEEIAETISGRELIGCDLAFYYLDLTNTATIRVINTPRCTYTIFCQAEDREFDLLRNVFQAITISLLKELSD